MWRPQRLPAGDGRGRGRPATGDGDGRGRGATARGRRRRATARGRRRGGDGEGDGEGATAAGDGATGETAAVAGLASPTYHERGGAGIGRGGRRSGGRHSTDLTASATPSGRSGAIRVDLVGTPHGCAFSRCAAAFPLRQWPKNDTKSQPGTFCAPRKTVPDPSKRAADAAQHHKHHATRQQAHVQHKNEPVPAPEAELRRLAHPERG